MPRRCPDGERQTNLSAGPRWGLFQLRFLAIFRCRQSPRHPRTVVLQTSLSVKLRGRVPSGCPSIVVFRTGGTCSSKICGLFRGCLVTIQTGQFKHVRLRSRNCSIAHVSRRALSRARVLISFLLFGFLFARVALACVSCRPLRCPARRAVSCTCHLELVPP